MSAAAVRPPRPRRSLLFMPASNARALARARTLDADGVILDLEDAVAPEAKEDARRQARDELARGGFGARERVVRVNGAGSPWAAEDLAAAATMAADAVLLPKVENAGTVVEAAAALARGGAPASLALWAMIETPRGVLAADAIAGAHPRLACLVLGTSDLAKELRVGHTVERTGLLASLSACVLAARANGLDVLDGVQLDLADDDALRGVCVQGRELGFDGKTLIHPRQIAVANEVFAPSPAAIDSARRVVEAWDAARARGEGLAVVDGRLVEHLHADDARRTLALADFIARRAGEEA